MNDPSVNQLDNYQFRQTDGETDSPQQNMYVSQLASCCLYS